MIRIRIEVSNTSSVKRTEDHSSGGSERSLMTREQHEQMNGMRNDVVEERMNNSRIAIKRLEDKRERKTILLF